jgi:hypothetical protein
MVLPRVSRTKALDAKPLPCKSFLCVIVFAVVQGDCDHRCLMSSPPNTKALL